MEARGISKATVRWAHREGQLCTAGTFVVVARGVAPAGHGGGRTRAERCAGRWGMRCAEVREGEKERGTGHPAEDTPYAPRASNSRPTHRGAGTLELARFALPSRPRGRCSRRRPLPHSTYPIAAIFTQCSNHQLSPLAQSSPHGHVPQRVSPVSPPKFDLPITRNASVHSHEIT